MFSESVPRLLMCVCCAPCASLQHVVRLIAFDRLKDYLEVNVPMKLGVSGNDGKASPTSNGAKRPPPDSTPDEAPEEKRAKSQ